MHQHNPSSHNDASLTLEFFAMNVNIVLHPRAGVHAKHVHINDTDWLIDWLVAAQRIGLQNTLHTTYSITL